MTAQQYQQKWDATKALKVQMAALHEKVENLCWKYAQPGCQTEERKARIDAMVEQYQGLQAQQRAIWAA